MWKDYFYFTKGQRNGLIALISLLILVNLANHFLPHYYSSQAKEEIDTTYINQAIRFKASLIASKQGFSYPKHYSAKNYYSNYERQEWEKPTPVKLFAFNPNEIDSAGFVSLGLKPFIAHNILKYRVKGGKFKNAEAFGKVYGIGTEQFEILKPYISIPEETVVEKPKEDAFIATIEINAADTAQLFQVKGMPKWLAKRIVFYREKLGGYQSVNQLKELKNVPLDLIDRVTPYFTVDTTKIQKIAVNKASIDRLKAHPYISYLQATSIYEYRRNYGKYKSVSDMKKIDKEIITPEFIQKLQPYFDFSAK